MITAFCLWSQKPEDIPDNRFNSSKIFRRYEGLVEWIMEHEEMLKENPVTQTQLAKFSTFWGMYTVRDKNTQQIVTFMEMKKADMLSVLKEGRMYEYFNVTTPKEDFDECSFYVTIIFHALGLMSLLPGMAEEGSTFVQDLGKMGFIEMMSLEPSGMREKMGK